VPARYILVPTSSGSFVWMSKEDGGSDEGMTKKENGQKVEDTDISYKSEFTNRERNWCQSCCPRAGPQRAADSGWKNKMNCSEKGSIACPCSA
jgi:hypothetical protein